MAQIATHVSGGLDLRTLTADEAAAHDGFTRACDALSAKRRAGATRLAQEVNGLLPALGMPGGEFEARLPVRPAAHAQGAEDVVFDVRLNAGLDPRPLARVASGGELSRLMLALKVVLAAHDAVPTLVFDEVDQGIGGEVGGRVGQALERVAQRRQALVITYLPQIAVHADHHLVVAKGAQAGVATSDVRVVAGEPREREIARMLGDPDMATALRHAGELLKTASAKSAARTATASPPPSARPRR
jgi:DNA repair protein RecN (Recombination protein N)